jgi:hypothetical protein
VFNARGIDGVAFRGRLGDDMELDEDGEEKK